MSTNYTVITKPFAERHYIKKFCKKYSKTWNTTWQAINDELQRFDSLTTTSIAEIIICKNNLKIAKTEFRIVGTNESRKSSGNRCIVAVHEDIGVINVLLVYHKNDLGDASETMRWKQIIKNNYPEYCHLF